MFEKMIHNFESKALEIKNIWNDFQMKTFQIKQFYIR